MKNIFFILLVFSSFNQTYSQNFWQCSLSGTIICSVTFYDEENILLAAGVSGIYKSTDDGVNWIIWTNGIIPDISHMSKNDSDVTFAATFLGVYRSTNIGTLWDTVNNGFQNLQFIRVFPENDRVFAGNLFGEIYKSTNLGDSWILIKQLPVYNEPFAYVSNENYIFFGINSVNYDSGGVIRSSDEGGTWEVVNNGLTIPSVLALAKNGKGEIFAGSNDGIYISSDNGNLWTNINNGINTYFGVTCIKILNNGDIYIGCSGYPGSGGLAYKSTNNGGDWELISSGLITEYVYSIDISPSGYLFACTFYQPPICGLHKSVMPVTEVETPLYNNLVTNFNLFQNYPNPFNPVTTIKFSLPEAGNVKLKIYNILGQELKTLVNEYREAGTYTINFSAIGGSASGGDASNLNSGMYIYRIAIHSDKLQTGSFVETRKMMFVK
ncbi:MAG: T9SS type A sorting domain-containing protein [Ignavibacteria bacterium]|nr:T9SS type A sorting domain-containing protein [Ignavibacteria bacterium]